MSAATVRALVPVTAQTALEPTSLDEAYTLCQRLVQSGLLKGIAKPEAAFAILLTGRELGLTAMQSLRSIFSIDGRPTLSADLMAALVKRSPVCRYFKLIESTATRATYETERDGEGMTRMSFTMEQAQQAGVTGKDNWKKYPEAMLRARCIAALARAVYPDLLAGIYETDELDVSPRQPAPRAVELSQEPTLETVADADLVEPAPAVESAEQSDEEKVAAWKERIEAASTLKEQQALAPAISAEPDAVKAAVRAIYVANLARFRAKAQPRGQVSVKVVDRVVGEDDA